MKRVSSLVFALLLSVASLAAQEEVSRDLRSGVFTVQHRDPKQIASVIRLLGSGAKGADIDVNSSLHTITVRDFPENIAQMSDAIRRLDQPAPAEPEIDLQMWVLIGSKLPLQKGPVPEELEPVVKKLQGSLIFRYYALISAATHHTKAGGTLEGSGTADQSMLGLAALARGPLFYNYTLGGVTTTTTEKPSVQIENFRFSLRYPTINPSGGSIRRSNVGFSIPVSLRTGEKVVIGATHLGDKALIVVVTATITP